MNDIANRLDSELPDRYALERELGRGGMAVVYLARDRKHDRKVAIKVFRGEGGGGATDRFLREVRIAANLTHPHILPLHDSGQAEGSLYYVMPYVEGRTLQDKLEEEGPLELEEALRIFREIADALAYAHSNGLVHRDIKPANIFFSEGHALLADFGIARAVEETQDTRLTKTGMAIGTPSYMSPEQWSGDGTLDQRSDLYSLACLLHEMLVGEPPFSGPTPHVVMAQHSMESAPSLREARPEVPEHVDRAVARALEKNPADRFESVKEFTEAVEGEGSGSSSFIVRRIRSRLRSMSSLKMYGLVAATLALVGLGYGAATGLDGSGGGGSPAPERIVVLPFENIGGSEADYFAAGVTDEITSRLQAVAGLEVIGRTSAMEYRGSGKSLQDITDELEVDYVMEGSVRWGGAEDGRARVTSRLLRAPEGTQTWSDSYDVSASEVLEVQTNIARDVAESLDVVLAQREAAKIEKRPTDDVAAYDLYLRGNSHYNRSWEESDLEQAVEMYRRATRADPEFALAFARLGQTHAWIHRLGYDRSDERLRQARTAIDSSLSLDPDLASAHIASGLYYYWGEWNYDRAMDELLRAREIEPGNALVYRQMGNVRRRQGEWEQAIEHYERAGDLDPRNHVVWFNLGETHLLNRDYERADRYLRRANTLAPNFFQAHLQRAILLLHRDGDVDGAREILENLEKRTSPSEWWVSGIWVHGLSRIVYGAEEALRLMEPGRYGMDSARYHLAKAEVLERLGRSESARAQYDSGRSVLERRQPPPSQQTPDHAWIEGQLGVAYAGLDRDAEALEAAQGAVELTSHDALDGPTWIANLARVYLMTGDTSAAVDELGLVLEIPSRVSRNWLRLDPLWEPVGSHPGLEELLRPEDPSAGSTDASTP